MRKKLSEAAPIPWVQILVVLTLLAFLIYVFIRWPRLEEDQRAILRFLMALLGGFSAFFIGGAAILQLQAFANERARVFFSATAGVAVFALLYLFAPYWHTSESAKSRAVSETPTPQPIQSPSRPSATPEPMKSKPPIAQTQIPSNSQQAPTIQVAVPAPIPSRPTPAPVIPSKQGRVLILIDEEILAQTIARNLNEEGVQAISKAELSAVDQRGIVEAFSRFRRGDLAAGESIPYAVIVTGKILITPLGRPDGIDRVEASGYLTAINIKDGQTKHRNLPVLRSGGNSPEAARLNILREASDNIPPFFINQVVIDSQK